MRRFEPTLFAPAAARAFAREVLCGWKLAAMSESAQLIVSELVTNAVVHTGRRFHLTISRHGAAVRMAVTDHSADEPVVRAEPRVTAGRGIPLVDGFSQRWGVELHDYGKTVWAELGPLGETLL